MQHFKRKPLPEGEYYANGRKCYSTGKVLIGLRYNPPAPQMGSQAEKIQAALLAHREQEREDARWATA